MEANIPEHRSTAEAKWQARERYWRQKLGRIRLGVEPIEDQVAKYRRVTWMLTAVPVVLALIFVALFTAFRRPDVGLILAGVLLLPVVTLAWFDFRLLKLRVARYSREFEEYHRESTPSGRT
ncbi:hypothetical protein V5E97_20685 [Singulisphaera sp. Ch08]|uniref:Integral membrane protein n=1 Tax=Singulisphaera sp. Ch08 TaxID=3120278 RepID=A0AAU7C702_9BACT